MFNQDNICIRSNSVEEKEEMNSNEDQQVPTQAYQVLTICRRTEEVIKWELGAEIIRRIYNHKNFRHCKVQTNVQSSSIEIHGYVNNNGHFNHTEKKSIEKMLRGNFFKQFDLVMRMESMKNESLPEDSYDIRLQEANITMTTEFDKMAREHIEFFADTKTTSVQK